MELRISLCSLMLAALLGAAATAEACEKHAALPKDSLYQVSSRWLDASGAAVSLKELRGAPVVVAMIYPRCKFTCPMIIAKLKKIEQELASKPEVKLLLVSFDHKNDTPATLKKFLEEKKLSPDRWKLLAGKTSGGIRELAVLLDTSYKLEKDGEISHSNVITLLDADGVKRSTVNGLNADHSGLVKAAEKLL